MKRKPEPVQRGWEPQRETEPVEPGNEWRCNCCTFRTVHLSLALAHLGDPDVNAVFPHMLWEVASSETDPPARAGIRRLYIERGEVCCDRRLRRAAAA